jgi:biotin transport system substrate-specific component
MSEPSSTMLPTPYSPLHLDKRPVYLQIGAVALGTLFLALASQVEVPLYPVPMTLQTLAVPLVGAFYGWRLGGITILAWLAEAAIGLPVLAGGAGGIAPFMGPTSGYLLAFPIIGAMTGWLAERGWNGQRIALCFGAMLLANLLCLVIGGAWLSVAIGIEKGLAFGVTPFLLGGLVKAALGAAIVAAASHSLQGRPRP